MSSGSASTASQSPATAPTSHEVACQRGRRGDPGAGVRSNRDGETRQFEILFTNLIDDEHVGGILLNARDVSERKAFEAELAHQAFHDTVTGLANRAMFAEQVRQAMARARRTGAARGRSSSTSTTSRRSTTRSGTPPGDEVLVEIARRLDANVRGADTAARFGGDEFAILLEDVESSHDAADRRSGSSSCSRCRCAPAIARSRCSGSIGVSVGPGRPAQTPTSSSATPMPRCTSPSARQGRLPAVRAGDARGRPRAARTAHRSAARARHRAARAALPARRAARRRLGRRRRGAAALAPPREGTRLARRVHPDRRGDRPDHPDRPLGAARGLPSRPSPRSRPTARSCG